MIEAVEPNPILKECLDKLTALATEASKCTPELQASLSLIIQVAARPPFLFTPEEKYKVNFAPDKLPVLYPDEIYKAHVHTGIKGGVWECNVCGTNRCVLNKTTEQKGEES